MNLYGLIIGIAVVIYYQLTLREWTSARICGVRFIPLFLGVIVSSLVGARLYHVADYWSYYQTVPWLIPQIWQGGLGVVGALVFGIVSLVFVARINRISTLVLLNCFTAHLLLALGLGRLANFFSDGGFWIEFIPLLYVYGFFWVVRNRSVWLRTHPLAYFLITYGIIRLTTDYFRTDLWYIANNVPVSTVIALLMVLAGLLLALIKRVQLKTGGQI